MLPTIGIMIGAYIFLRSLEIVATLDRVQSKANRVILVIVAVGVILISIGGMIGLAGAGASDALLR